MYSCTKHQDKPALSFCHNCGKFFCRECLTEGKEFYYCSSPDCRNALLKEKDEGTKESGGNFVPAIESEYTRLNYSFNKMDAGVFASILDNAEIDYYSTMNYFIEMPVEFYIVNERIKEAEEIASKMDLNSLPYSTKGDIK